MFIARVSKNIISLIKTEPITSGSSKVYTVRFEFSKEWDDLGRTAVFRAQKTTGELTPIVHILLDDTNECLIPWEVMEDPGGLISIGAYGLKDEDVILPTIWTQPDTILEGVVTSGGIWPSKPTADLYQQILNRLLKAEAIDLTQYYTKDEVAAIFVTSQYIRDTFYTKKVSDDKYATKTALSDLSSTIAAEYYNKTQTDNKFATKDDLTTTEQTIADTYYNKTQSDETFATKTELSDLNDAIIEDFYDKTQVDTKLDGYATIDDLNFVKEEAAGLSDRSAIIMDFGDTEPPKVNTPLSVGINSFIGHMPEVSDAEQTGFGLFKGNLYFLKFKIVEANRSMRARSTIVIRATEDAVPAMKLEIDLSEYYTKTEVDNLIEEAKGVNFTVDDTLNLSEDDVLSVAKPIKTLTKEEYDALSEDEKMADVVYVVTGDASSEPTEINIEAIVIETLKKQRLTNSQLEAILT